MCYKYFLVWFLEREKPFHEMPFIKMLKRLQITFECLLNAYLCMMFAHIEYSTTLLLYFALKLLTKV